MPVRHPALLAALSVVVALTLCALALGAPFYHTNDDPVMSCIVAGAGWIAGERIPSPYAVFIHVALARPLVALYTALPGLPWYGLMLLAALAAAAGVTAFAGLRLASRGVPALALLLLGGLMACEGFAHLHFGVAATLLAASAVLWALSLAVRPARSRRATWASLCGVVVLAAWALGLRPEGAWLGLLACAPLGCVVLARRRRAALAGLAGLALFGLLHLGARAWQRAAYAAAPGWEEALDWMEAKGDFVDHARISYSGAMRAVFDAAGWSGNDLELLRRWFAWDPQLYSATSIRAMQARLEQAGVVPAHNLEWPRLRGLYVTPPALAALALAFAVGAGLRRRAALVPLAAWLGVAGLLFAVGAVLRTPPLRVHLPAWLLVCASAVFWLALGEPCDEAARLRRRVSHWATLAALLALVTVELAEGHALAELRAQRGAAARRDLERLQREQGPALYLNWAGLFPMHELLRPLDSFAAPGSGAGLYARQSFFWIGWPIRLPVNRLWLARQGIVDLYDALHRRADLLVLTQPLHLPVLARFLEEHRGLRVRPQLVMVGETVSVYRFVDQPRAP